MKRGLLAVLAAGLLVTGLSGKVQATTIAYQELYDPADILVSAEGAVPLVSWTFDITDNPGWGTPDQQFNAGTITLVVYDDRGSGDGSEKATFTFEAGTGLVNAEINPQWGDAFTVGAGAFTDGLIWATVTATTGDFYFGSATLNASSFIDTDGGFIAQNGTPLPAVPEPSTVVLLGSGLLGLVYTLRRRDRK